MYSSHCHSLAPNLHQTCAVGCPRCRRTPLLTSCCHHSRHHRGYRPHHRLYCDIPSSLPRAARVSSRLPPHRPCSYCRHITPTLAAVFDTVLTPPWPLRLFSPLPLLPHFPPPSCHRHRNSLLLPSGRIDATTIFLFPPVAIVP
jgi:hypothetical protein